MGNMDYNLCECLRLGHSSGLEGTEAMSSGIGLKEEIVLFHVMDKALLGQGSICNPADKLVLGVFFPVFLAGLQQVAGQRMRIETSGSSNMSRARQ